MIQPTYQSRSVRIPFFTTAPAARSRVDRHHRVDEGGGIDHAQRLGQVAAPPGHRRVGQEQLVELALELGRQIARGAAEAHLLFDLGHDLGHVGLRVRHDGRRIASARVLGHFRHSSRLRLEVGQLVGRHLGDGLGLGRQQRGLDRQGDEAGRPCPGS